MGSVTTRRTFLKGMAAGGVLAMGGGVVASCSQGGSGAGEGGVDIVLTTHDDWPYGPVPKKSEQKANPSRKAYADALTAWMDKNPGITIMNSALDVWNQEALTTAISGGTSPSLYPGDVIGGWNRPRVRAAMVQGLSADVTEHLEQHDFESKLADYVKPIWKKWAIDGKFYAAPWAFNIGPGVHYRIDLIRELGLKEPTPDWTWKDVRELAKGLTEGKRKGIVLQGWGFDQGVSADGMDFHAQVPAPDSGWNWAWDYMAKADDWIPLIEHMRGMVFDDESVMIDVSMPDGDIQAAFVQQAACMHVNSVVYHTATPQNDDPPSPSDLADKLKKPIYDVAGFMTFPVGANGRSNNTQGQCDLLGFSPDLDDEEIDAALSLHTYMRGPGWVAQKNAAYDATKDPRRVYDWEHMMPLFAGVVDEVQGSPEEAWGKEFMDTVNRAGSAPLVPNEAWYFTPEENQGPTTTAREDMRSHWANEKNVDIRSDLQKLEDTRNEQAAGFTSSTPDEEFVESADEYFKAHADYWQENAPEYYESVVKDWYEGTVLPALGK